MPAWRARGLPIAGAIVWLAYVLLPTTFGWLDGIPAGRIDAMGLLMVLWIAAHGVRLHGEKTILAALLAAAAGTAVLPGEPGLEARQFANPTAAGAHERGTEYPDAGFTRVDRELLFGTGIREFPLAFFNDNSRFNFYQGHEPQRRLLAFSITWAGFLKAASGPQTLYLDAPGASAELFVDGQRVLAVSPGSAAAEHTLAAADGWRRLHVVYLSEYGAPRQLSAGQVIEGKRVPFGAATVRTARLSAREHTLAVVLDAMKKAVDAAALLWLAAISARLIVRHARDIRRQPLAADRGAIALAIAAGAIEAVRFAWPWTHRLLLLPGGDDPMTYEHYARDIQFNGILMNWGRPPGTGEPFYYQAFYPYFVAAVHAVFGEDMFGVLLLQRLFVMLIAAAIVRIAVDVAGRGIWPAALAVGVPFIYWKFAHLANGLLTEALYVPLLMAWTAVLIRTCARPSQSGAVAAGLLGGLTAITRSTVVLSWAIVWPLCAWMWRRRGWARWTATMVGCSLAVFSLITIRNWVVARTFAPTSTEFGITLLGGNEPPPHVTIDLTARREFYNRFDISDHTAKVIEFAITAPDEFARGMGRKALFALGFYESYAPGWGRSPVYILVWSSALVGLAVALRRRQAPRLAILLPGLIALTQFVALVVVYPKGERLIVPVHTLLVPYSGIALAAMAASVRRIAWPRRDATRPTVPT